MQRPSRRHFLAGSAVPVAALSGCLGDENVGESPGDEAEDDAQNDEAEDDVPDDLAATLEAVPAESAVELEYQTIMLGHPSDPDAMGDAGTGVSPALEAVDDLDTEDVSHVLLARSLNYGNRIGVLAGSFDRPEPGTEVDAGDGWRIGTKGQLAFATAEDRVVFAAGDGESRTDRVRTAAEAARGTVDAVPDVDESVPEAFVRLGSSDFVFYVPTVDERFPAAVDHEKLRAFAAGFDAFPGEQSGTVENEYLLYPADGASLDDETVTAFLREIDPARVRETEIDRGDAIRATVVSDVPPENDRQAAPDAEIRSAVDASEGTVEFEHAGGETIDAAELELWLDGELAPRQPADEFDEFAAGDALEVSTDPLATAALRWIDEEEKVQYVYDEVLVGRDAFEADYDLDAETVEITYRGEREADPEKLAVTHRSEGGSTSPRQFGDAYDALSAGDSVRVDGVGIGDRVTVELEVPSGPSGGRPTLLHVDASSPEIFFHQREDGVVANYYGQDGRSADEFRVLVDGDPADVQFSDVHETLSRDDRVDLGDLPIGSEVVVEWVEPDEPVEVGRHRVAPRAHVELEYSGSDGTLHVEHRKGDAIDAEDLSLRIAGEPAAVQPADEYDTFEPGDALATDAEPFAVVELVWTAGGDADERLARAVTGREALEAVYDPDAETVELVYDGPREADPDRLAVRRGEPRPDADGSRAFADEYDTLTGGDSIVLDDVGHEEHVRVSLAGDADSHYPLLRFSPKPRGAFAFDERDGRVVAVYHQRVDREADGFRLLADGEETDVQPADVHDTLEFEDEIELGEFPVGTELAVEWVVPADPVEIRTHTVVPDAAFEADYDPDAETLTVEHAGGEAIDAGDLSVFFEPGGHEPIEWGGDGTVEEGDSTTLSAAEEVREVHVLFREHRPLDRIELGDDRTRTVGGDSGSSTHSDSGSSGNS